MMHAVCRLCVCAVCGVQLYRSLYKVCRLCVCDACSVQVMCVYCMQCAGYVCVLYVVCKFYVCAV